MLSQEILAKKVLVAYDDSRRVMIDAKEVLTVISNRGNKPKSGQNDQAPPTESA